MNKIKLLTVAGSLVMAPSLMAPTVVNAFIFEPGTVCMPANLNQALQGIGWSQAGVVNNSTTSFFVVCPLLADTSNPLPTVAFVTASFPAAGGTVECIVRTENINTQTYTSLGISVTGGVPASLPLTRGQAAAAFTFTGVNASVVCALDPGEGINYVAVG